MITHDVIKSFSEKLAAFAASLDAVKEASESFRKDDPIDVPLWLAGARFGCMACFVKSLTPGELEIHEAVLSKLDDMQGQEPKGKYNRYCAVSYVEVAPYVLGKIALG